MIMILYFKIFTSWSNFVTLLWMLFIIYSSSHGITEKLTERSSGLGTVVGKKVRFRLLSRSMQKKF